MYGLGILGNKVEAFTKRVVKATKYIKAQKEYSLADQFFQKRYIHWSQLQRSGKCGFKS